MLGLPACSAGKAVAGRPRDAMTDFTAARREALARHLRKHLAGEVRFDPISRQLYSTDASIYRVEPLGVVIPKTADDIVTTVQVAAAADVPLTARGGGTSLSGQSIGPGIVLDCSKYLNAVVDLDPAACIVRVQPGVVLDQLNRTLAAHDLQFGPDVSTSSRANLGGMIGNNSAGARSIVYGKTIDHVRRLEVVLSDGSRASCGPLTPAEWERREALQSREGAAYRAVRSVALTRADEIRRRFPRILRRVSGYNLDRFVDVFGPIRRPSAPPPLPGLHELLVGSEGTLAVMTEAELNVVKRPKSRGLLVPQFATLAAAMDAVAACLEASPSAIELLDHYLLSLCAGNLSLRDTMKSIQGRPEAVLMVEFSSDDAAEVADRVERLARRLNGVAGITALVPAIDPALRDPLWDLRRAAMPLLYGMLGDRKPVTFVEDCAVAPEHLPAFVARFRALLQEHGTDGAFYGHASVGCLHIRPVLNLKDATEVAQMRRITEAVTDLVLEYGGALSGEHGDGLARSEWNAKMFGPVVYEAFREVKRAFDPQGILNPGRVVNGPPMTESLRYGPDYHAVEPITVFDYSKQEGFVRSVEMCNGNGACRKMEGGTMCPSYRATRDEKDTTRARANALRMLLANSEGSTWNQESGKVSFNRADMRGALDVFDLCLMCKACKSECPSNVDVAKLKAELLQFYYDGRPRPLGQYLMAEIHRFYRLAAPFASLVNRLQESRSLRWILEKIAGIDRRRSLPPLQADHFRRWFARHAVDPAAGTRGRVLLLDDCFTTYNEPAIGRSAIQVLERAGYSVELAGLVCCGRPMLSKGFLRQSKRLVREQAPRLARRIAEGTPLLGLEPGCLSALSDEWPDLLPGPETRRIAAASRFADSWLAGEVKAGRCSLDLRPLRTKAVLHGHCHQKALVGTSGSAAALRLVPGLDVSVLDTGCCGMAGSFGFEREHFDLSAKIAGLSLLPALAAAPEAVAVAPGTSCRHQIHDLASRRALHPLEVLAGQLDGPSPASRPTHVDGDA
jgi:FAD/FMN-containing dehydrogenase/Fe-S oxidoreductase